MIFSWDKFLRPLSGTDTNIQIMNNAGVVTQTINPFAILNLLIHNNTVRVGIKSGQLIIIPFSTQNEAKLALPRLKIAVDLLQKKRPIFIDNQIKNFVKSETTDFFYQEEIPIGTFTETINVGSLWYDLEVGLLYIYVNDEVSGLQWITAIGEQGPAGLTGSQGFSYQFSGTISSSQSLPLSATAGTSFIDDSNGVLYVYNSTYSSWVSGGLIRGTSGTSGLSGTSGTSGTSAPLTNYTIYKALVTLSSGTFTVTQLENTIGDGTNIGTGDIVWSNPSNGVIKATKSGAFTSSNIVINVENINGGGVPYICMGQKSTTNFISVFIFLHDGTLSTTPNFTNLPVEIRIYN